MTTPRPPAARRARTLALGGACAALLGLRGADAAIVNSFSDAGCTVPTGSAAVYAGYCVAGVGGTACDAAAGWMAVVISATNDCPGGSNPAPAHSVVFTTSTCTGVTDAGATVYYKLSDATCNPPDAVGAPTVLALYNDTDCDDSPGLAGRPYLNGAAPNYAVLQTPVVPGGCLVNFGATGNSTLVTSTPDGRVTVTTFGADTGNTCAGRAYLNYSDMILGGLCRRPAVLPGGAPPLRGVAGVSADLFAAAQLAPGTCDAPVTVATGVSLTYYSDAACTTAKYAPQTFVPGYCMGGVTVAAGSAAKGWASLLVFPGNDCEAPTPGGAAPVPLAAVTVQTNACNEMVDNAPLRRGTGVRFYVKANSIDMRVPIAAPAVLAVYADAACTYGLGYPAGGPPATGVAGNWAWMAPAGTAGVNCAANFWPSAGGVSYNSTNIGYNGGFGGSAATWTFNTYSPTDTQCGNTGGGGGGYGGSTGRFAVYSGVTKSTIKATDATTTAAQCVAAQATSTCAAGCCSNRCNCGSPGGSCTGCGGGGVVCSAANATSIPNAAGGGYVRIVNALPYSYVNPACNGPPPDSASPSPSPSPSPTPSPGVYRGVALSLKVDVVDSAIFSAVNTRAAFETAVAQGIPTRFVQTIAITSVMDAVTFAVKFRASGYRALRAAAGDGGAAPAPAPGPGPAAPAAAAAARALFFDGAIVNLTVTVADYVAANGVITAALSSTFSVLVQAGATASGTPGLGAILVSQYVPPGLAVAAGPANTVPIPPAGAPAVAATSIIGAVVGGIVGALLVVSLLVGKRAALGAYCYKRCGCSGCGAPARRSTGGSATTLTKGAAYAGAQAGKAGAYNNPAIVAAATSSKKEAFAPAHVKKAPAKALVSAAPPAPAPAPLKKQKSVR